MVGEEKMDFMVYEVDGRPIGVDGSSCVKGMGEM